MTTLTLKHRDDAIESILREAFAPRFAAIEKEIDASVEASIAEHHPIFVSALADPELAQYIATCSVGNFFTHDEHRVAFPKYSTCHIPPKRGHRVNSEFFTHVRSNTLVPVVVYNFVLSEDLSTSYHACWADYIKARDTLRDTFYSYKVREKLISDFPEFEKYLPVISARASVPMVIAASVRATLSSLGVPAS